MSIPRGTTPTFVLSFDEDIDLTAATSIFVTFSSDKADVTKTGADLEITQRTISVSLTQEESFLMNTGIIEIQANWMTTTGRRVGTTVARYPVSKQLLMRII